MVTVLMSTYNGEKYIREQIDSILKQEGVEVRLLIRDDGSTDNTMEILNEYKNRNKNIELYSDTNLGCGKSFYKLVLDAPISDYYAFADQDDVWDSDKLLIAVSKLSRITNNVPALYCSAARPVDEKMNTLPQRKSFPINLTLGIALTQAIAPGCTYVFNDLLRNKYIKLGIENINIHDWAILRVVTAVNGYVFYDNEPHFSYRQHGNNVIGYQNSFVENWIGRVKRFRKKEYRKIRYEMALKIKEVYYNEMTNYNKSVIDTFINYNKKLKNKIKLITSKDIRMLKMTDNIIFKLLVLLNLV